VTGAGAPPPPIWPAAVREGLRAFGLVAGVGVAASVIVWAIAGPAYGLGVALGSACCTWAFHTSRSDRAFRHRRADGRRRGSDLPTELLLRRIGIAPLGHGSRLLAGVPRRSAAGHPRGLGAALRGAAVAHAYSLPVFLVALLVAIEEPVAFGRLVEGELRVSLAHLQALVFPLVLAVAAGAAGGLWAWLEARPDQDRAARVGAALAGGWRMLWLGLALSYAGLFARGWSSPTSRWPRSRPRPRGTSTWCSSAPGSARRSSGTISRPRPTRRP
jgi:hypothetical protein